MAADDDGVLPAWYWTGDTSQDDGLAEDGATKDVTDGAVRALPHLLQLELLHSRLIRSDRRTLDAHTVLLDRLRRIERDLVVGLITVRQAQVVVLDVELKVRQNELGDDGVSMLGVF